LALALREAIEGLGRLPPEEEPAWRHAAYYLLLLIYHRRERQEWEALAQVILEAVRERVRREEIETMGKTIAEALIEEGKELGLEQGILQSRRDVLLRQMRAKFGPLPPALVEQIEAIGDVTQLDALLEKVLTAGHVEEMGLV
jgi:hypothetical protein